MNLTNMRYVCSKDQQFSDIPTSLVGVQLWCCLGQWAGFRLQREHNQPVWVLEGNHSCSSRSNSKQSAQHVRVQHHSKTFIFFKCFFLIKEPIFYFFLVMCLDFGSKFVWSTFCFFVQPKIVFGLAAYICERDIVPMLSFLERNIRPFHKWMLKGWTLFLNTFWFKSGSIVPQN